MQKVTIEQQEAETEELLDEEGSKTQDDLWTSDMKAIEKYTYS